MAATILPATTGYRAGLKQDDVLVSYGIEAAWGVPPAVGQYLRLSGHSLAPSDQRKRTNEFDGTTSQSSSFRTSFQAGGTLNGLLTAGTWDDFLANCFTSVWATQGYLRDGSTQSTPGAVLTPTFFTIEVNNGGLNYLQYTGCLISKFSLSMQGQSEITVSADVLAKTENQLTAPGFTSYAPINSQPVFKFGANLTSKSFGGAAISSFVDQIDLTFTRSGATRQYGDGTFGAIGMGVGMFEVSGSIRCYFNSAAIYNSFVAQTKAALALVLTDDAGNVYSINLGACILTSPTQPISRRGGDLMQTFTLMPEKDANGVTCYINRTPVTGVRGSFSYQGA